MIVELPLTTDPSQRFVIQLGATKYTFWVKYNSRSVVWTLDLFQTRDNAPLLSSIPIVLGVDLLWPYNLAMGHLIAGDSSGQGKDATADDLGSRVKLFWYSEGTVL